MKLGHCLATLSAPAQAIVHGLRHGSQLEADGTEVACSERYRMLWKSLVNEVGLAFFEASP